MNSDDQFEVLEREGRVISCRNEQSSVVVDLKAIVQAAACTLQEESVDAAQIDIAVVDDRRIHEVNREFLGHDYPTDVISFCYESDPLEGELIVSVERACAVAGEERTDWRAELAWYVVHGTLHVIGYDDGTEPDRRTMRARERRVMRRLGWRFPEDDRASGERRSGSREGKR